MAEPLTIFVSGEDKNCFGGLHAANLASAFSKRETEVRIYELSGVLPNACFYFSHPPQIYLGVNSDRTPGLFSGLGGVDLSFDVVDHAPDTELPLVNIIHLPPLSDEPLFRKRFDKVKSRWKESFGLALFNDRQDVPASFKCFRQEFGPSRLFALSLRVGKTADLPTYGPLRDLGALTMWEPTLVDRVPIVLRSPNARLAREYLSICDSMLSQMTAMRRMSGSTKVAQVSAGSASR